MSNSKPQSLEDAIILGASYGAGKECFENIYIHVREFVADQFCKIMVVAEEQQAALFEQLFKEIVRRNSERQKS